MKQFPSTWNIIKVLLSVTYCQDSGCDLIKTHSGEQLSWWKRSNRQNMIPECHIENFHYLHIIIRQAESSKLSVGYIKELCLALWPDINPPGSIWVTFPLFQWCAFKNGTGMSFLLCWSLLWKAPFNTYLYCGDVLEYGFQTLLCIFRIYRHNLQVIRFISLYLLLFVTNKEFSWNFHED